MTSFDCLLFNVGCNKNNLCKNGHCMLIDSNSDLQFNKKHIEEYFDLIKGNQISVGIFQEVCNNEFSGIRNSILSKFKDYKLSPYKGLLKKIFVDDEYNSIKDNDLNDVDIDDIDYEQYLDLEEKEKSAIDISKDLITTANNCDIMNLFDQLLEHYGIKNHNIIPYNDKKGCGLGKQYIDNNEYFYKLNDVTKKNNFLVKINDFYAISPFKYFRMDFIKIQGQHIIFINIHINPHLNTTELYSNIKNRIIESIIAIINEVKKYLIVNPHIIILGDFNEGSYFNCKNHNNQEKDQDPYTYGNKFTFSNELQNKLELKNAKGQIIELYKNYNRNKKKNVDEKKCHLNILYSESLQITILDDYKDVTDNYFVSKISSHLPILFRCTVVNTKIIIMNECKSIIKIIQDLCKSHDLCLHLDSDTIIFLLHSKIIESSNSYYEFAKKSIFLCVFNVEKIEVYQKINDILISDNSQDNVVLEIFNIIMENYSGISINGGSYSYYLKYMKYKNKYNSIK